MAHDLDTSQPASPFWGPAKRHYTVVEVEGRGLTPELPKGARLTQDFANAEAGNYRGRWKSWWVVEVSGPRGADAMEEWFSDQTIDWFTRKKDADTEASDHSYGMFLGLDREL